MPGTELDPGNAEVAGQSVSSGNLPVPVENVDITSNCIGTVENMEDLAAWKRSE